MLVVIALGGNALLRRGEPPDADVQRNAAVVMYLAYGLFKRAVPVLVDRSAIEPEALIAAVRTVPGVRDVARVRSRWVGPVRAVDMVVTVDPDLVTTDAHAIADDVERLLGERFQVRDTSIHLEPDDRLPDGA